MNKIQSQTANKYDKASRSNPSLITAGLPSGSIMTTRLIQPSLTAQQNCDLNQNQAINKQPIIASNSQQNVYSHHTAIPYSTTSDTYLNLSCEDIDDVMMALHTLAECIQSDLDNKYQERNILIDGNESHYLSMLYSRSTNHIPKSSTLSDRSSRHYDYRRYSIQTERHSLASDCCNSRHRHHHRHCRRRRHVIKLINRYPNVYFYCLD